ncbi:MAG: efflux RND transporter periplasmic adaptor subunit [Desulfomonilaceae bacterium]
MCWRLFAGFFLLCFLLFVTVEAGPSVLVETALIKEMSFTSTITTYGRTQPDSSSVTSVNLPRSGVIARLWVRSGQLVEAGSPLVEFQTSANASMDYEKAVSALEYARSKLNREEELFKSQLTTREQVASARKNLADAEAQLEAQRKLGTAQLTETLKAPFAGVVIKLNVNEGDLIQAGANVVSLARRDSVVVLLGVEPEEANKVHKGMLVTLSPVFEPDVKFRAEVNQVHAMINPSTRLVEVLVSLKLPSSSDLPLGLTMKGVIILSSFSSLSVPRDAVLKDHGVSFIFVVSEGRAHRVVVDVKGWQEGFVAIGGSVAEGEEVVTLGNYELKDGMTVRKGAQ